MNVRHSAVLSSKCCLLGAGGVNLAALYPYRINFRGRCWYFLQHELQNYLATSSEVASPSSAMEDQGLI